MLIRRVFGAAAAFVPRTRAAPPIPAVRQNAPTSEDGRVNFVASARDFNMPIRNPDRRDVSSRSPNGRGYLPY